MQYSQEHLKTMVYAEFGGQTECIMGNWKIENVTIGLGMVLACKTGEIICTLKSCQMGENGR